LDVYFSRNRSSERPPTYLFCTKIYFCFEEPTGRGVSSSEGKSGKS